MSQSPTAFVAAEVRAEMGRQDIDRTKLAERLGKSEMWVSRRLRCITEFSVADLVAVADALEVSPSSLLPDQVRVGGA